MMRIKWVENVLGDRNELTSLLIDEAHQLENLNMEGEVLNVVGQPNHTNGQLNDRMDQKHKLLLVGDQSQNPELHTVVELPTVNVLNSVLGQIVPNVSQMEA